MICRKLIPYLIGLIILFSSSIAVGQDWLGGGYVGSYSGDIAQFFTDPIFYPNQRQSGEIMYYPYFGSQFFWDYAYPYEFRSGTYPGPYGVYPYYPTPYNSDFRLSSIGRMNWEPFQKNWSETMEYAQTKSSFRVYPQVSYTYPPPMQAPITTPTTGDTPVTIVSEGMRGYQVFVDGNYIGTEGTGGDVLDGRFSFSVVGNQNHDLRVWDGQFSYPKTMFFERGVQKIIYVEPGTSVNI